MQQAHSLPICVTTGKEWSSRDCIHLETIELCIIHGTIVLSVQIHSISKGIIEITAYLISRLIAIQENKGYWALGLVIFYA